VIVVNESLKTGQKPEIFNTDLGSHFTLNDFTKILIDKEIQVSMDGKDDRPLSQSIR